MARKPSQLPRSRITPSAVVLTLMLLGLAYIIGVCAWQSDDAYITFRTARNACTGGGLTWNPGARVQPYTHPLWMMIGVVCYAIFHEVYFSTLVVSILLAVTAATLIVRTARSKPWIAAMALLLLATSGAFADFSTSGLENALLYVLLVRFVLTALRNPSPRAGMRTLHDGAWVAGNTLPVWNEAGFFGYFSGSNKTVIDVWGLADPLLARIPLHPEDAWRIGHFRRSLPEGYFDSRRQGRNLIKDPELARIYDALQLVTRGPLFTAARWREIWRFNTGYDSRILAKRGVTASH